MTIPFPNMQISKLALQGVIMIIKYFITYNKTILLLKLEQTYIVSNHNKHIE